MSELLLALTTLEVIVSIVGVAEKALSAPVSLELDGQEEWLSSLHTTVIVLNGLYLRLRSQERVWRQNERINAKTTRLRLRQITNDLPVSQDNRAGSPTEKKHVGPDQEQLFEPNMLPESTALRMRADEIFLYLQEPPGLKLRDQKAWRVATKHHCELIPELSKRVLATVVQSLCPKLQEHISDLIEDIEKLEAEV